VAYSVEKLENASQRLRDGLSEAITWVGALDHATGCRVDAETVPMRAYVTSGDPR